MMEIRIETDLDSILPKKIDFNYDELRTKIDERLSRYSDKASTNDQNYQERKDDRARLNKLSATINNERKEIKKRLLAPMESSGEGNDNLSFTKQIDDLIGKIAMVVGEIDEGIKKFEESKRESKRKEIDAYISEVCPSDIKDAILAFSAEQCNRRNNAWLNMTCQMSQIKSEIDAEIKRCNESINMIESFTKDDSDMIKIVAIEKLRSTGFNLQSAINEADRYRAIERDTNRKEEKKRLEKEREMSEKVRLSEPIGEEGARPPEIYSCTMKFVGTLNAFENLKQYMEINNGLTYTVVEQMALVK